MVGPSLEAEECRCFCVAYPANDDLEGLGDDELVVPAINLFTSLPPLRDNTSTLSLLVGVVRHAEASDVPRDINPPSAALGGFRCLQSLAVPNSDLIGM